MPELTPQEVIINEADRILAKEEKATINRVATVLSQSFIKLQGDLQKKWGDSSSKTNLFPQQRALLLAQQLGDSLNVLAPNRKLTKSLRKDFEALIQTADKTGRTLADDLIQSYDDAFGVASVSRLPLTQVARLAGAGYDRLLGHGERFAQDATVIMGMGMTQGWGFRRTASALRSQLGTVQKQAERIVRTESMQAMDSATRERYVENDIEFFQRIATLDERVCPFCAARAGNVYKIEGNAGAVLHPNDRCYSAPWSPELELFTDPEFAKSHHEDAVARLAETGRKPNSGLAPFEKLAKLVQPPKPYLTASEVSKSAAKAVEEAKKKATLYSQEEELGFKDESIRDLYRISRLRDKFSLGKKDRDIIKDEVEGSLVADDAIQTKVDRILKMVPSATREEAIGLAAYINGLFQEMNRAIWDQKQRGSDPSMDALNNATHGLLSKAKPLTKKEIDSYAKNWNKSDFNDLKSGQLKRFVTIESESIGGFVKKYKDALARDGVVIEEAHTSTSLRTAESFSEFAIGSNVEITVKPKLDGTGRGVMVDKYKNHMDEGEVLYPAMTKFKVTGFRQEQPRQATRKATTLNVLDEQKFAQLAKGKLNKADVQKAQKMVDEHPSDITKELEANNILGIENGKVGKFLLGNKQKLIESGAIGLEEEEHLAFEEKTQFEVNEKKFQSVVNKQGISAESSAKIKEVILAEGIEGLEGLAASLDEDKAFGVELSKTQTEILGSAKAFSLEKNLAGDFPEDLVRVPIMETAQVFIELEEL